MKSLYTISFLSLFFCTMMRSADDINFQVKNTSDRYIYVSTNDTIENDPTDQIAIAPGKLFEAIVDGQMPMLYVNSVTVNYCADKNACSRYAGKLRVIFPASYNGTKKFKKMFIKFVIDKTGAPKLLPQEGNIFGRTSMKAGLRNLKDNVMINDMRVDNK